jgi:hypothetical protein
MMMTVEPNHPVAVMMGHSWTVAITMVSIFRSGRKRGTEDAGGRKAQDQSLHNQLHAEANSLTVWAKRGDGF